MDVDLRKDTPPPSTKIPIPGTYEEVAPQAWNTALEKFQKKNKHHVVELIARLLMKKQGDGISLIELKVRNKKEHGFPILIFRFISTNIDVGLFVFFSELQRQLGAIGLTDKQLLSWIEKMRCNKPPLVTYVGPGDNILVSSSFVRSWAPRLRTTDHGDDGTLVPARMWYDIQGKIMEHVLRGCMQAVLEQIQRNPGISSATVLHKLKTLLVPGEVYDILRMLEQRQCIKSKAIAIPASTTLFSSPRLFQTQGTSKLKPFIVHNMMSVLNLAFHPHCYR